MTRTMGFFVGLGAGVAAGVLFAPRRGEETRTMIQKKAEHGVRYVKRHSHQLKRDVSGLAVGPGEAVKAAFTAGKRAYVRVAG